MADKRYKESGLGKFMQKIDPTNQLSDELNALAIKVKSVNSGIEAAQ